jgi:hypothetical protein
MANNRTNLADVITWLSQQTDWRTHLSPTEQTALFNCVCSILIDRIHVSAALPHTLELEANRALRVLQAVNRIYGESVERSDAISQV